MQYLRAMKKYRKSDQYYVDEYDRRTILLLKELEIREAEKRKAAQSSEVKQRVLIQEYVSLDSFYHNAVMRARNKANSILTSIQLHEQYDRLVAKYPEPQNISCKTCNSLMFVCNHFFKEGAAEILFVFECPQGHSPKRALYPSGEEFYLPQRRCEKCSGLLHSTTKKTKKKFTVIETCKKCKSKRVDEIDIPKGEYEPINEEERIKYCNAYVGLNTFREDLHLVDELAKSLEKQRKEKEEQEKYSFDIVLRLKIPQLEDRLLRLTEKKNYTKLSFEKPVFSSHTVLQFSLQDPTSRSEKESLKQLQKIIQADLFLTNWRLIKTELTYRMGYLTGKVKGFEQDDDILKISKEIHEKRGKDCQ